MRKNFVLDTNVLLHDPSSLFAFEDNNVILPIYVIEEVDKFKRDLSELGRSARAVSRTLDGLRHQGALSEGIKLEQGGQVRVAFTSLQLPEEVSITKEAADSRIIAVALDIHQKDPETPCILVSKDVNLRLRADAIGLRAEDYETDRTDVDELYAGFVELEVDGRLINALYAEGSVAKPDEAEHPNQYVKLLEQGNPSHSALAKVDRDGQRLVRTRDEKADVWGIKPRNMEQAFALDALLDDSISLVTLVGKAGTGKTLVAIAAGLQRATEEQEFQKVLVSRPVMPMGKDLGYLPGTVEEKLSPWMQPIFDNVEFLMGLSNKDRDSTRSYRELMDLNILQIEPLTYIRGRSIPNQYMIVDEAQNLTPHEVKTILTRAGEGTKIVLTGDPYQIDNPYIDASNNGLVHAVNRFVGESLAAHISLKKGERSALAECAANVL